MIDPDAIQARFDALEPFLNERDRRLFAASEARAAGRGGIAAVSRTTGMARSTIGRGLADLRSGAVAAVTGFAGWVVDRSPRPRHSLGFWKL